jgi:hypothetical protein
LTSVFVPVPGVGHVPVAVVDVVGVIAVLNRLVAAGRPVLMSVLRVHDVRFELALVIVPIVVAVSMAIVQVVDMIVVLDRHVAAIGAVLVLVAFEFTHIPTLASRTAVAQHGSRRPSGRLPA